LSTGLMALGAKPSGRAMPRVTSTHPALSIEVFPPKTPDGLAQLCGACDRLAALQPEFVSVTCRPGPDARHRTYETVKAIRARLNAAIGVVPHITGVGSTRRDIRELLAAYGSLGIDHFVVIRGDRAPDSPPGDFAYASELVAFIRAEGPTRGRLHVAAHPEVHPEASSAAADLAAFQRKVRAGADSAITQYVYSADSYLYFVEDSRRVGVTVPIVPGILPITNYERLARFSEAAGVEIPRWLRTRLEDLAREPAALHAFGLDVVGRLCGQLLDLGAPGLHFYTLNDPGPTLAICERLRSVPELPGGP
jgi:methylenetetrahydrofolate reductase (NADPH)